MENIDLNIEAEGFAFKYSEEQNVNMCYTRPYPNNPRGYKDWMVDVIYNRNNNWVLICQGDNETPWSDWTTMFAGQIHTQEDFKKVLSMVII